MTLASLRTEMFVPHPPSKVWRALTEPELLARWWIPGDIAPVVGHAFTLDAGPMGQVPSRVLEVIPEERFVFTFPGELTVAWTLAREEEGTRIELEHAGFDLADPNAREAFENMGPGWRDQILPRLARVLETSSAV